MKLLIIPAVLSAGLFLTGCETTVYDRPHHGYGYRESTPTVYVHTGYSNEYGHSDNYRHHNEGGYHSDGGYRTRGAENTRVINNTVNETNVVENRTTVSASRRGNVTAAVSRERQPQQTEQGRNPAKKHRHGHEIDNVSQQ